MSVVGVLQWDGLDPLSCCTMTPHQWDGTALLLYYGSRSVRSEAGSELGAAPPEEEAEFPAVCSGGRGLLTPRNPEKNAAGSGG